MEFIKLLSTNEIVAQIVNFLLLLFLLRIFFWKRILKILDERKERIASELTRIEETKQEVERLRLEYQKHLDLIDEESRVRIEEALEKGRMLVDEMRKEAHDEAQKMVEAAKQDIRYKIAKAKEEVKEQLIDLTIKATQNLISEKLTADDDKKIVEDFLREVDKTKE
jgi:F-type H+-transporting ATPase subunit b